MFEALDQKVGEVYSRCVDDEMTNISTLEKLTQIESHVSSVLQSLNSIPEEKFKTLNKIMNHERRTRFVIFLSRLSVHVCAHACVCALQVFSFRTCHRQREEKLREQQEKQEERMRKYDRMHTDLEKNVRQKLFYINPSNSQLNYCFQILYLLNTYQRKIGVLFANSWQSIK